MLYADESFGLLYFFDSNAGDYAALVAGQTIIAFWNGAQPFHCETLQCEKEWAQIATANFHIV